VIEHREVSIMAKGETLMSSVETVMVMMMPMVGDVSE